MKQFWIIVPIMTMMIAIVPPIFSKNLSFTNVSKLSLENYEKCINKAGYYDIDLGLCASDELDRQSDILRMAYRAIVNSLAPVQQKRLILSERAWAIRRDRSCDVDELAMNPVRGTLDVFTYRSCLVQETADRIQWLERNYGRK